MKYIFLDTNIYILSALSTQPEHKIESLEKLKHILKQNTAKLLLPEVVKIEFQRNIDEKHGLIQSSFEKLKDTISKAKFSELPILEEEKKKLANTLQEISKEKEKKFQKLTKEIEELFNYTNVETIALSPEIFSQGYLRCLRREKPFKKNKDKSNMDEFSGTSWMNDALIVESLLTICNQMNKDKDKDTLIFCTDNIEDFAEFDKEADKHILHKEIQKNIAVKTKYYRHLPEMLTTEFKTSISKKTVDNEKTTYDLIRQIVLQQEKQQKQKEFFKVISPALNPNSAYINYQNYQKWLQNGLIMTTKQQDLISQDIEEEDNDNSSSSD